MNDYYTAYIMRGDEEIEVSAKLYDYGKAECGMDNLGGQWMEIIDDPIFTEYAAFDLYGVELTLTPKEISSCEKQMISQYWDQFAW